MNYKYKIDGGLYEYEINYLIKNSPFISKMRKKPIKYVFIVEIMIFMISLILNATINKYNRSFVYIFLELFILTGIALFIIFMSRFLYLKLIEDKRILNYWKKEYIHTLEIKEDKIYYSDFGDKKIELNDEILQDFFVFNDICGIVVGRTKKTMLNPKRMFTSIIIIPKDIFESTDEFNRFKDLIKNKLKGTTTKLT